MTPEQFTYWLQGFVEIRETEKVGLTEKEWNIITDHLKTVFHKVTPVYTPQPVPMPNYDQQRFPPINPPYEVIC